MRDSVDGQGAKSHRISSRCNATRLGTRSPAVLPGARSAQWLESAPPPRGTADSPAGQKGARTCGSWSGLGNPLMLSSWPNRGSFFSLQIFIYKKGLTWAVSTSLRLRNCVRSCFCARISPRIPRTPQQSSPPWLSVESSVFTGFQRLPSPLVVRRSDFRSLPTCYFFFTG